MYFQLAAKVANAVDIILEAQQQGENDYVEGEEIPIVKLPSVEPEKEDSYNHK